MRTGLHLVLILGIVFGICMDPGLLEAAPTIDQRLTRLEDTVDVVRDYNDDFLSLVVWALTTVATLVVLLLSFNWFQSQRSLRREMESLRSELRAYLDSRVAEAEDPLRERLDKSIIGLEEKLKFISANAASSISSKLSAINERLELVELRWEETDFEKWMAKGVLTNATRSALRMVQTASAYGSSYLIGEALDCLSDVLQKMESEERRLDADLVRELERTMGQLGSDHSATKETIKHRVLRINAS